MTEMVQANTLTIRLLGFAVIEHEPTSLGEGKKLLLPLHTEPLPTHKFTMMPGGPLLGSNNKLLLPVVVTIPRVVVVVEPTAEVDVDGVALSVTHVPDVGGDCDCSRSKFIVLVEPGETVTALMEGL